MSATLTPGINTPTTPPTYQTQQMANAQGAAQAALGAQSQYANASNGFAPVSLLNGTAPTPAVPALPIAGGTTPSDQTMAGTAPPQFPSAPTAPQNTNPTQQTVPSAQMPGAPAAPGGPPGVTQPGAAQQIPTASPDATTGAPTVTGYNPYAYQVTPNQTVAGQISNIISEGSPLMQEAEANARNQMNQRGLINSTMGITAGQAALYAAATPIATADAQTFAQAATNTTTARNTALKDYATAANTASIAKMQADNNLTITDKNNLTQTGIANINANVSMSNQDKQDATSLAVTGMQTATQKYLGELSANTQMSLQDKVNAGQMALAQVNNLSAQQIAHINADATLSVADKQTKSAQIIAGMNNENARIVQQMINDNNMAQISANNTVKVQIEQMADQNKTLLQTSAGAAQLYNQALTQLAAIVQNKDLNTDQQTTASNNIVVQLKDGLAALNGIANNTAVTSNLDFSGGVGTVGGVTPSGQPAPTPATPTTPTPPAVQNFEQGFSGPGG